MKSEIRILGFDDGSFSKSDKEVIVVGVVLRGNSGVEGVLSTKIAVDGLDSTERLAKLVNSSKHKGQLRVVMIQGTTLGGLNIVDLNSLSSKVRIPVLGIIRKKPSEEILKAVEKVHGKRERLEILDRNGEVYKYRKLYFQMAGLKLHEAYEVIDKSLGKGDMPECLRLAHLIASGITLGESHGRA